MEEIDIERLRNDLINYYGTAMVMFPMAVIDLNEVYNANDDKLIEIAINNGFNIENYVSSNYQLKKGGTR